jgi:hypothetical protein
MGIIPRQRSSSMDRTAFGSLISQIILQTVTTDSGMPIEITNDHILVDAELLARMLTIESAMVPALMQARVITSICEKGLGVHQGQYRLSFFFQNRRARLSVDRSGNILQRSIVNFGEKLLPRTASVTI